jgi:hypothetical protein
MSTELNAAQNIELNAARNIELEAALEAALVGGRLEQVVALTRGLYIKFAAFDDGIAANVYSGRPGPDEALASVWCDAPADPELLAAFRVRHLNREGVELHLLWAAAERRLEWALGPGDGSRVVAPLGRGLWEDLTRLDWSYYVFTLEPRGWRALHDRGHRVSVGLARRAGARCRQLRWIRMGRQRQLCMGQYSGQYSGHLSDSRPPGRKVYDEHEVSVEGGAEW